MHAYMNARQIVDDLPDRYEGFDFVLAKSISQLHPQGHVESLLLADCGNGVFSEVWSGLLVDSTDQPASPNVRAFMYVGDDDRIVYSVDDRQFECIVRHNTLLSRLAPSYFDRYYSQIIASDGLLKWRIQQEWYSMPWGEVQSVESWVDESCGRCGVCARCWPGSRIDIIQKKLYGLITKLFTVTVVDELHIKYLLIPYDIVAKQLARVIGVPCTCPDF